MNGPLYRVLLHNDNSNKREYVVKVLLKVVDGMTVDDAVNVMHEAHVQVCCTARRSLHGNFSEHFTEYTLLMFALNGQRHDMAKSVADKSNFLYHYPEISRNRGKGFDYRENTDFFSIPYL